MSDCNDISEHLAAFRDGVLDPRRQSKIERHLESCRECRDELRRDECLVAMLQALPAAEPPPVDWRSVHAARSARRAPGPILSRRLLAGSAAAIALAATTLLFLRERRIETPPAAVVAVARPAGYENAHLMTSLGEIGADPNRAIILAHVLRGGGDEPR